jgi:ABC transporter substrate binding protein
MLLSGHWHYREDRSHPQPSLETQTQRGGSRLIASLGASALVLFLLTAPLAGDGQQAGKMYRLGFLGPSSASDHAAYLKAFREGLRDLGYEEGKNIEASGVTQGGRTETQTGRVSFKSGQSRGPRSRKSDRGRRAEAGSESAVVRSTKSATRDRHGVRRHPSRAAGQPDCAGRSRHGGALRPHRRIRVEKPIADDGRSAAVVVEGGLISYGSDFREGWRVAARYVDRILKGSKPANLPVEQSTKFEWVINLKTANTPGVTIPQSVLARTDEIIR